jgi:dTDP-4-dehydrorhamnose 3,5-epimerase
MSQLKVDKTGLNGVLAITPPTNFEDFRGSYVEIYNHELFQAAGLTQNFIQDDISTSTRGVLRGIHGDGKTWKLISCLYGSFYFVVVNNNPESDDYKKSIAFTLSDRNRLQILVPPKFGNGHLVMSEEAIFHYKQTTTYDRSSQFTIKWNDPDYAIWWPTTAPILSQRDSE